MKLNKIPVQSKAEVEKKKHQIKNISPEVSASFSSLPSKHRTNDYNEHKPNPPESHINKMSTINVVSTKEAPRFSTFSSEKMAQTHIDIEKQQLSCCKGVSDHDDQQQHHHDSEENLPERENARLVSLGPCSHLDSNSECLALLRINSSTHYIKPPPPRVPPKPLTITESVEHFNYQENIGNSRVQYNPELFREKIENFEKNFLVNTFDSSGNNGYKVFNTNIITSNNNNTNNNINLNINLRDSNNQRLVSTGSLSFVNGAVSPRILRYDNFGRRKKIIVNGKKPNGITCAKQNLVKNGDFNNKTNLSNSCYSSSAKELNSSMLINDIDKNIYSLSEENIYNINNNNNNNTDCEIVSNLSDVVNECNCDRNSYKSLEGLTSNPIKAPEAIEVEVSYFTSFLLLYKFIFEK